jgi:hypothetical protein
MYAKVFGQIFDSSITEDYLVRLVFMDFLVLADRDGVVDITAEAIARRTNVPLEVVRSAIHKLSAPDPQSRTSDAEGRRIVLLDEHRAWGWRVVNYKAYCDISDEEARRAYMRDYMRNRRNSTEDSVNSVNSSKQQLAHVPVPKELSSNADASAGDLPPEELFESSSSKSEKASQDEAILKVWDYYLTKTARNEFRVSRPVRCALISREDNPSLTAWRLRHLYASKPNGSIDLLRENLYLNSRKQSPELMLDNPAQVAELIEEFKARKIEFAVFDVFNVLHAGRKRQHADARDLAATHDDPVAGGLQYRRSSPLQQSRNGRSHSADEGRKFNCRLGRVADRHHYGRRRNEDPAHGI